MTRVNRKTSTAARPEVGKLGRAVQIVVVSICSVFLLEGATRTFHGFRAPLLPYRFDHGAARLPPNLNLRAAFGAHPSNQYVTDAWGARIERPVLALSRLREGVIALGDSQILGYMLNFEDTFSSLVAAHLIGNREAARLLAAPANHIENMREALEQYNASGAEAQRLLIAGVNLGNDLDEMYSEAMYWTRYHSSYLDDWMLTHSFLWMDWTLIRTQHIPTTSDPVGVNRILYMLDSPERVCLAREAVRTLEEFLDSPSVNAQQKIVVIIPADIQIDPKQFQKYRRYYGGDKEFDLWDKQMAGFAEMMNAIEEYMAAELGRHSRIVIRLSKVVGTHPAADRLFDNSSHHLTAESNRLLAQAIVDKLSAQ